MDKVAISGSNPLMGWYLESRLSQACSDTYVQSGGGPNDLYRDLIVLKAASRNEKGVILLKYARTFEAIVALLDVRNLMRHYSFVLEPCWSGYCDPALLMYADARFPIVVQCFTDEDFEFVTRIGQNMIPIRLGPADWVNADVFRHVPDQPRIYDLVMVANWGTHKRHSVLFNALRQIRTRDIRVLLIGFAWAGRTSNDISREAANICNPRVSIEILENLPHAELAVKLAQCGAFVFLSRKEGDNKALVEAMFADVPAIVFDHTIGGARSRINPATGVLSSDSELPQRILEVLERRHEFSPRAWAIQHSGSRIATQRLDEALRRAALATGAPYTRSIVEKVNSPNLAYRDDRQRAMFTSDYDCIASHMGRGQRCIAP